MKQQHVKAIDSDSIQRRLCIPNQGCGRTINNSVSIFVPALSDFADDAKTPAIVTEKLAQQSVALTVESVAEGGVKARDPAVNRPGNRFAGVSSRDTDGGDSRDWPESENDG